VLADSSTDQVDGGATWDKRLSTSKTMALAWTVVLAFMVVTIALIAIRQGVRYLTSVFENSTTNTNNPNGSLELYLVLLGGPYAAAVFAMLTVVTKLENQQLQKTDGPGRGSLGDLVGGDTGTVDLVDFQYTPFNLIGLVIVLGLFCTHPGGGLPGIPAFLATLLGGSALTYTVNKAAQSNAPTITGVFPQVARINETVAIVGSNLSLPADPKDTTAKTQVTVGGVDAPVDQPGLTPQSDRVEFKVPTPKAGTGWDTRPQDVRIKTTGGATADAPASLQIVDDTPYLDGLDPQLPSLGERLTLSGDYFDAVGDVAADGKPTTPAKNPTVHLEWTDTQGRHTIELTPPTDPPPSNTQLTVAIPLNLTAAPLALPVNVSVSVRRDGNRSGEISAPFGPPATPTITALRPDHARIGQTVLLAGDDLSLDPHHRQASHHRSRPPSRSGRPAHQRADPVQGPARDRRTIHRHAHQEPGTGRGRAPTPDRRAGQATAGHPQHPSATWASSEPIRPLFLCRR
jgi:hypothetical protein